MRNRYSPVLEKHDAYAARGHSSGFIRHFADEDLTDDFVPADGSLYIDVHVSLCMFCMAAQYE